MQSAQKARPALVSQAAPARAASTTAVKNSTWSNLALAPVPGPRKTSQPTECGCETGGCAVQARDVGLAEATPASNDAPAADAPMVAAKPADPGAGDGDGGASWLLRLMPELARWAAAGVTPWIAPIAELVALGVDTALEAMDLEGLVGGVLAFVGPLVGVEGWPDTEDCCEGFRTGLVALHRGLASVLTSDAGMRLRGLMADAQTALLAEGVGTVTRAFARIHAIAAPILALIDEITAGFVWVRGAFGSYADAAWQVLAPRLGLDPALTPGQALMAELGKLWDAALVSLDLLACVQRAIWRRLLDDSWIGDVVRFLGDCGRLYRALLRCVASVSIDPSQWLAILAQELDGTVFATAITALQGAGASVHGLVATAEAWFIAVLEIAGAVEVWEAATPTLRAIGRGLQVVVSAIRGMVAGVRGLIRATLTAVAEEVEALYAEARPLLDVAAGLSAALVLGPVALGLFLGGLAFRALPECHQVALADFILAALRTFVLWSPADTGLTMAMRELWLTTLDLLEGATTAAKVTAMETLSRLLGGDFELYAGVGVGFLEGLWDSTPGLVLRLGLKPFKDAFAALTEVFEAATSLTSRTFSDMAWVADQLADAGATVRATADPSPAGDANDATVATSEVADDATFEAPPAPELGSLAAEGGLFDAVFRDGVSRTDIEAFLATMDAEVAGFGRTLGEQLGSELLARLTARATVYEVGQWLGWLLGFTLAEALVLLIPGAGWGASLTAKLSQFGRVGVLMAEHFPRFVGVLRELSVGITRGLNSVNGAMGRLYAELGAYMGRVVAWAERQLARALAWIEQRLGPKASQFVERRTIKEIKQEVRDAVLDPAPETLVENPLTVDTASRIPAIADTLAPEPHYRVTTLKLQSGVSDTAGVEMMAERLTHVREKYGSEPKEQEILYGFGKLPKLGDMGGAGYKKTQLFIRGHLLNEKLGGPGLAKNLYPITDAANFEFSSKVENPLKQAVHGKIVDEKRAKKRAEKAGKTWKPKKSTPRLVIDYHVEVVDRHDSQVVVMNTTGGPCTYEYVDSMLRSSFRTYRLVANDTMVANAWQHLPDVKSVFDVPGFTARMIMEGCPGNPWATKPQPRPQRGR